MECKGVLDDNTVVGQATKAVRKIFKALIALIRRPYGRRQPPPTPPKIGGELTAMLYFVLALLLFKEERGGGKSAYRGAFNLPNSRGQATNNGMKKHRSISPERAKASSVGHRPTIGSLWG